MAHCAVHSSVWRQQIDICVSTLLHFVSVQLCDNMHEAVYIVHTQRVGGCLTDHIHMARAFTSPLPALGAPGMLLLECHVLMQAALVFVLASCPC